MMFYPIRSVLCCLLVLAFTCTPLAALELQNEKDRISYSVGYQVGGDFKRQKVELNAAAMVKGVEDAMAGGEPLLTQDEMRQILVELKKRVVAGQEEARQQARERYLQEGQAFFAANAKKEGVVTLPSGLQYKVIKSGSGSRPQAGEAVRVNYRATFIDGTEFDSSYKNGKPATFRLDSVLPGLREGLLLMEAGSHWQLFLPGPLAFGEQGPMANRPVIFDLDLLEIVPPDNK
ncbi:MAG: FKBP-type peptidyl-prolyl cis-trans isomerase [Desulfobulbaceae bacterium]|nr:FKBP-type peptidyl-prolyl cis-trans isomerase [Desulfobulbaceae bacterium]